MKITEVKVFPIDEEKLKAFVSVVFDHCFMVNDIKIIQGRQGLFISMPSRKKKNGEFKDVAHPLNNQTRKRIEAKVLGEYDRIQAERPTADGEERVLSMARRAAPEKEPERRPAEEPTEPVVPLMEPLAAAAVSQSAPQEIRAQASEPSAEPLEGTETKTLEEVQEMHLRDSFWNVS